MQITRKNGVTSAGHPIARLSSENTVDAHVVTVSGKLDDPSGIWVGAPSIANGHLGGMSRTQARELAVLLVVAAGIENDR